MPIYFSSSVLTPPTPTKKCRKLYNSDPVKPTLLNLPYCAINTLLLFLDVDSLENLSKTCSYFDEMIAGKYLTSINFPFPADFIKEIIGTNRVDKKPLLKLICKKSREELDQSSCSLPSLDKLILNMSPDYADYLVLSQLALLSLHLLREVDLVPYSMKSELYSNKPLESVVVQKYNLFDSRLLQQISRYY